MEQFSTPLTSLNMCPTTECFLNYCFPILIRPNDFLTMISSSIFLPFRFPIFVILHSVVIFVSCNVADNCSLKCVQTFVCFLSVLALDRGAGVRPVQEGGSSSSGLAVPEVVD